MLRTEEWRGLALPPTSHTLACGPVQAGLSRKQRNPSAPGHPVVRPKIATSAHSNWAGCWLLRRPHRRSKGVGGGGWWKGPSQGLSWTAHACAPHAWSRSTSAPIRGVRPCAHKPADARAGTQQLACGVATCRAQHSAPCLLSHPPMLPYACPPLLALCRKKPSKADQAQLLNKRPQ